MKWIHWYFTTVSVCSQMMISFSLSIIVFWQTSQGLLNYSQILNGTVFFMSTKLDNKDICEIYKVFRNLESSRRTVQEILLHVPSEWFFMHNSPTSSVSEDARLKCIYNLSFLFNYHIFFPCYPVMILVDLDNWPITL